MGGKFLVYNNYIYGIFNQNSIQEQLRQQQLQQHHNDQVGKSIKCANKLDEFLKSIDDERVIIRTKLEKPSKIKGLALI